MFIDLTIGSIMLGLALLLLVIMVLARPLLAPPERPEEELAEEAEILYYRKENLLRQVRELDDDLESGKIAPEYHQHTRPGLVAQAALIMKKLDGMGMADRVPAAVAAAGAAAGTAAGLPAELDAQIEAAVRRLRSPDEIDAQIEAAVKSMRSSTSVAPAPAKGGMRYCPKCGRRLDSGDRFCAGCGYDLKSEKSAVKAA